jgi:DNA-binding winged helix-turn-helix (wHTH) protein
MVDADAQLSFGPFRLHMVERKLSRDGKPVKLGSRAIEILCVLAAADGKVVSKDELMAKVWPGLVVEEANIQVHVSSLRKALEEGGEGRPLILTVPGRGYRLSLDHLPKLGAKSRSRSSVTTDEVLRRTVQKRPFTLTGDEPKLCKLFVSCPRRNEDDPNSKPTRPASELRVACWSQHKSRAGLQQFPDIHRGGFHGRVRGVSIGWSL